MKAYPALCLNVGRDIQFIHPAEIILVQSEGSYSHLTLQGGIKITVSKKIKDIESILPEDIFVRVHHSTIINLMFLSKFHNNESSEIELTNGTNVKLSRRKKTQFMSRFVKI